MFLARRVDLAKWGPKDGLSEDEIPADAVTINLKSSSNRVSFWGMESDSDDNINDVVLVLAAGRDTIQKVEIAWIECEDLQTSGVMIEQSEGKTDVADMVDRHYDLCQLDYTRLGEVAQLVSSSLQDERYKRVPEARVEQLLVSAVEQDRVALTDLREAVQERLRNAMDNRTEA